MNLPGVCFGCFALIDRQPKRAAARACAARRLERLGASASMVSNDEKPFLEKLSVLSVCLDMLNGNVARQD